MTTFSFRFTALGDQHFAYRPASQLVYDVLRTAASYGADLGTFAVTGEEDGEVVVVGNEAVLRLAAVTLNLHAEQSPWDATPVEQGAALERVLAPLHSEVGCHNDLWKAGGTKHETREDGTLTGASLCSACGLHIYRDRVDADDADTYADELDRMHPSDMTDAQLQDAIDIAEDALDGDEDERLDYLQAEQVRRRSALR